MATRDIIVIGSSAGGIPIITQLLKSLPAHFPGSLFIVQHLAPYYNSELDILLDKAGPLKAVFPKDGEAVLSGHIYVATPDHHLLVEGDRVHVAKGPKENRFRPSIDALFRSAAYSYGPRVIGIVLSGALDDGTSGLWSVKRLGGVTIVQDPAESSHDSMPTSALAQVDVDYVLPVREIGPLLERLVKEPLPEGPPPADKERTLMEKEIKIAAQDNAFELGILNHGSPTLFTCPECHGALVQLQEGPIKRYRCHTGHAYSTNALLSEVTKKVEEDLWNAVRGMEETVLLLQESGKQYEQGGKEGEAGRFYQKASEVQERSGNIRSLIAQQEQLSVDVIVGGKDE